MASNLLLLKMEPVFKSIAEERNPGNIFSTTVDHFEEVGDHVIVRVKMADGQIVKYRAQYVVCCDAGKLSTPKLGKAVFSKYWDPHSRHPLHQPRGRIHGSPRLWYSHADGSHLGQTLRGMDSDFRFPSRSQHDALVPRIRQLLKLPDLEMEVLHISHESWTELAVSLFWRRCSASSSHHWSWTQHRY